MYEVIVALITGGFTFAGVVLTNATSNKKMLLNAEKQQAVTDEKLDNLKEEVRKHNNFAMRMPALEEKISNLEKRIDKLESEVRK